MTNDASDANAERDWHSCVASAFFECATRCSFASSVFDEIRSRRARMASGRAVLSVTARPSVGRARRARGVRRVACRAGDDVERSNYKETSSAVKNLVSGLTAVVNAFGESGDAEGDGMTRKERREARPLPTTPRDPNALVRDISREFTEAKYLWTGDITPEMYDLFCTFTDPTLSFVGLDTFERNLKNLQPVLRRLVRDSDVELYACELLGEDEAGGGGGDGRVRASWRMTGNLRLPWRPRIDLEGRTTFTFRDWGEARGCLITAYNEEWELSAGEAVSQLVRPFQW